MLLHNAQLIGVAPAHAEAAAQPDVAEARLFAAALRERSNLELDWLWLYTRLSDERQRRYCLERALFINPHCAFARRELAHRP